MSEIEIADIIMRCIHTHLTRADSATDFESVEDLPSLPSYLTLSLRFLLGKPYLIQEHCISWENRDDMGACAGSEWDVFGEANARGARTSKYMYI